MLEGSRGGESPTDFLLDENQAGKLTVALFYPVLASQGWPWCRR
jgi:hypothetical protein